MQLELTDEETRALLNLLIDVIEADRYPNSPRIRLLQAILAKCGDVGGLPPELAARVRRYAPPPPARRPTPEERDPGRGPRQRTSTPALTFALRPYLTWLKTDSVKMALCRGLGLSGRAPSRSGRPLAP
jgi:hypothetical protein